jgi:hypothetical protein
MGGELIDNIAFAGITAAIIYLLCAGVYLVVRLLRWINKAEHPRQRVLVVIRASLSFLLLHGISLICVGGSFFLAREVLYADLPIADRDAFIRLGWTCLLGGIVFAIPAALGRRFISPTAGTDQGRMQGR